MQLKFAQGISFKICTCIHIKVQSYETEEREAMEDDTLRRNKGCGDMLVISQHIADLNCIFQKKN